VTKQAAEEIGGSIEMDTQQGAGTCMTVRLPLAGQPETVRTSSSLALLPGDWLCYPEVGPSTRRLASPATRRFALLGILVLSLSLAYLIVGTFKR